MIRGAKNKRQKPKERASNKRSALFLSPSNERETDASTEQNVGGEHNAETG